MRTLAKFLKYIFDFYYSKFNKNLAMEKQSFISKNNATFFPPNVQM